MLERLTKVPWGELNAAYGPAEWVPEALWGLLDPDPDARSDAVNRLEGGIFHQQGADEATPHVVPFLIELTVSPATPDRPRLLFFLAWLIGTDRLDPVIDQDMKDQGQDEICYSEALACITAAWDGAADIEGVLDDPDPAVRIASGCVMAALAIRGSVAGLADAAPRFAHKLRERLARETDPLARAGHAFALGTVASRVPEARAWLRAVEESTDLADPAGLACSLRLVDLGEPSDGPAAVRFVERLLRFDPVALNPSALVGLPWWSGPDIYGDLVSLDDVEDSLLERFVRLSGHHPEIVAQVERRASGGRGIERANALRLLNPRSEVRRREWPAVEVGPDEDPAGVLALATVALRGDASVVSRWATPIVADALRQPDIALRRRASWFLHALADTGLAPRVSEFAEAARGERDPAVLVNLARALRPTYGEAARLSLDLLQGWLDAPDGPSDQATRQYLWRTIAGLTRHAPVEETAAWLLERIDDPARVAKRDPYRAEAVAVFRKLRLPEWELGPALARWLGGDPDPRVRRAAVYSSLYNPVAADRMPQLDILLAALRDDPDAGVRLAATEAVASILMDTEYDPALAGAVVRALAGALDDDPDYRIRQEAARNLGLAAPTSEEAQGVMSRHVMRYAALGQSASGSDDAVEALIRAVGRDPRHAVRDAASHALQNVSEAVPGLVSLLRSAPPWGRAGAADALAAVGQPAKAALPELFDALADEPEVTVRRQIAHALFRLLFPREEVGRWIGPLARTQHDEDVEVRHWIAWIVADAGPVAAPLVPGLAENLGFEHESLRCRSLEALGEIGRLAEAALPAVLALAWSPSIEIRLLALKTAKAINGDRSPHADTPDG